MITPVYKRNIKQLWRQIKVGAERRNIEFNLSLTELNEMSFPITCPCLGIPLVFNRGKAQDNSYSIDRIDSSKGYEVDNVVIISNRANKLKSDATLSELESIVNYFKSI